MRNFQRNFLNPLVVSLLGVAVLYGSGIRHVVALISLSICLFTFSTIVLEFYRGTRARRASTGGTTLRALGSLMTRNRRRYGGYIVHFGVVLIFLGITGSSAYKIERDIVLEPMEQATVGDFTLRYETLERDLRPTHEALKARVAVSRGGRQLTTLYPERRFYFAQNQPTTEVALRTSLLEDLYIILAGFEPTGTATFKVFVNPLVAWLWLGRSRLDYRYPHGRVAGTPARGSCRARPIRGRGPPTKRGDALWLPPTSWLLSSWRWVWLPGLANPLSGAGAYGTPLKTRAAMPSSDWCCRGKPSTRPSGTWISTTRPARWTRKTTLSCGARWKRRPRLCCATWTWADPSADIDFAAEQHILAYRQKEVVAAPDSEPTCSACGTTLADGAACCSICGQDVKATEA